MIRGIGFTQCKKIVTETELWQIDDITPQAALHWDGLNHSVTEQ